MAFLRPVSDNADILICDSNGVPHAMSYREIGRAFWRPPVTDQDRRLMWAFWKCVARVLRDCDRRVTAIEGELSKREREALRQRLQVIEGGNEP
jgi:hypothetical protein